MSGCDRGQAHLFAHQASGPEAGGGLTRSWPIPSGGPAGRTARIVTLVGVLIAAGLLTEVADRAIQVFGAMGLSPDTPLADLYTAGRALRFADGPDEVHLQTIARLEARDQQDRLMAVLKYLEPADMEPAGEDR